MSNIDAAMSNEVAESNSVVPADGVPADGDAEVSAIESANIRKTIMVALLQIFG